MFKIIDNFLPSEQAQFIAQQIIQDAVIELGILPINTPAYTNINPDWFQETKSRSTLLVLKHELLLDEARNIVNILLINIKNFIKTKFLVSSVRINYMTPDCAKPTLKYDIPHVDIKDIGPNMYTLMYYVNDSHGDTILYNETCRGSEYLSELPPILSCLERIAPRKNKLVIFDANRVHSAPSYCTEHRYIINLNITTEFPLDYDQL